MSKGESILLYLINEYFNKEILGEEVEIKINTRPNWLHGYELDFYLPKYNMAFEFQGEQHYTLSSLTGNTWQGLKNRIYIDELKRVICEKHKIALIDIPLHDLRPKFFKLLMKQHQHYAKGYKKKMRACYVNFMHTHNKTYDKWLIDIIVKMEEKIKKENGKAKTLLPRKRVRRYLKNHFLAGLKQLPGGL